MRSSIALLAVMACSSEDEPTPDAFLEAFEVAVCTQQLECHPNTWIVANGVPECRERLTHRAVDGTRFSGAGAEACLDAIDALGCSVMLALEDPPEACLALFVEVPPG